MTLTMNKRNVIRLSLGQSLADDMPAAIESFKNYCRSKNLSPNSIAYYHHCLLCYTRFLDSTYPGITPAEITPQVAREFLIWETKRNSAANAAHCHTALRVFFGFLAKDGFLESSPMDGVEKPRKRKLIIETFTLDQVQALLGTCKRDFIGVRDSAMMLVMMDCGLRVSELLGLAIHDVSWAEQTLLVLGKGDKERVVPFGNVTRHTLSEYLRRRGELDSRALFVSVYGEPIDRYRVLKIIHARGEKAGITGVRCSPHTFRHTFAVQYLRNGGDVFSLQM